MSDKDLTMSLADSLKLTQDTLQAGVIEILGEESKLLANLPFRFVEGSGITYTVQKNQAKPQYRTVGEAYKPSEIEYENRTESLAILGDEAIVDTYQNQIVADYNDLMAIEVALKTKALAHAYQKAFLYGNTEEDIKAFNGLNKRLIKNQMFQSSGIVADDLDILADAVRGANFAIMSKSKRRKLTNENRSLITKSTNEFGVQVTQYGEIVICDLDDEVFQAGDEGSIYVMRLSDVDGVCGLQNGGINVTPLGHMTGSPKLKTRIEWFTGMAVYDDRAIAKIEGIETE